MQNDSKTESVSYWKQKIENGHYFSTVPYLRKVGILNVFENSIQSNFGFLTTFQGEPPEREDNDIKEFSKKSRLRLFNLLHQINYSDYGFPIFASCTWHHDFTNNRISIKNFLKNFYENLKNNLPAHKIIWKLEYQKRGAPHYHFMLLPDDHSIDFRDKKYSDKIFIYWLKNKKCKCAHCKKYSVDVRAVNDFKHAMIYISKELGKCVQDYGDHDLGRIWGNSRSIKRQPIWQIKTSYANFRNFLSAIFEKKLLSSGGEIQLIAMKDFLLDSNLWISHKDIEPEIFNLLNQSRKENVSNFSKIYKGMVSRKIQFGKNSDGKIFLPEHVTNAK